ncbi:MAG: hypothetical protein KatS3mg059_1055 [Thermomicrobiales bacterium]|nr:MAG: hypothetical protein KatS3mg059_1055 [Thermomicrobiales bacterium]
MVEIRVVAERIIGAPPERVYGVLRDYREHHPKILPPAFSDVRVEEGGAGEGTVVAFTMNAGGRRRRFRARIDEPEPGRVLRETDLDSGAGDGLYRHTGGFGKPCPDRDLLAGGRWIRRPDGAAVCAAPVTADLRR